MGQHVIGAVRMRVGRCLLFRAPKVFIGELQEGL